MQASEALVEQAGGPYQGSLNFYDAGGNSMVATLQVDGHVYVVGQDDFAISHHDLAEWLGESDQDADPPIIANETATDALAALSYLREDCMVWQCGSCDAWIHTSNRPRVGVLRCSTCGDGGVDFRHADRHVGGA